MTQLVGLVGSLRKESINRTVLRALASFAPAGVTLTELDYSDVPLFNSDLEVPSAVERLKAQIAAADGLIIATPEYNYGVPGVLKNVLDWLSRPAYKSVLANKPTAILGASPGPVGTARAQGQLKQVIVGVVGNLYPSPDLTIGGFSQKFDSDGRVTDESTEKNLRRLIDGFSAWVGQKP